MLSEFKSSIDYFDNLGLMIYINTIGSKSFESKCILYII